MKFLLDQSTDARLGAYLRQFGYDVTRIAANYPAGLLDPKILSIARSEGRLLITDDRDFGEWVFRFKHPHAGVIFLRLGKYAPLDVKIARLSFVLTHYKDQLDQFIVVKKGSVRIVNEL
jgi:predicted nuclease of predicted toxin-antitoxin system